MMKKILLIILAILAVMCCAVLIYNYSTKVTLEKQKDRDSGKIIEKDENAITLGSSYAQILDYISGDGNYMLVIGKKNCSFCDMYKPVLEEANKEHKFKFMYVDIKSFSNDDAHLFFNSEIIIPGKCHSSGNDSHLVDGFGTPLTLFIKNKTSYDCIRGYVDKDALVSKLKEISFID